MTWACELTEDAEPDLRRLPRVIQKQFSRTLTQMAADPFEGNVKALRATSGAAYPPPHRRLNRIDEHRSQQLPP